MDSVKKKCGICERLHTPGSGHIQLDAPDPKFSVDYDICRTCARELIGSIKSMRMARPKKCDFCKHDRGPLAKDQQICRACRDYSNFELKPWMGSREKYEWALFNGDV